MKAALDRLRCAYAIVFGFGGLPLLYMGDELGMFNDLSYLDDPTKKDDNRWIHRPAMDWKAVKEAQSGNGLAGQVLQEIKKLISSRKGLPSLHASVVSEVFTTNNPAVLVFRRRHAAGVLTQIYNLSEKTQIIDSTGIVKGALKENLSGRTMNFEGAITVPPYATWWLS